MRAVRLGDAMTEQDDLAALTGDISRLAQTGSFNPFALIAGEDRFHSLFLAPFSPTLQEGIARFILDGGGSLAEVVKVFQANGASMAEALENARRMFSAARAMLVVVMAGDHGVTTIPQLFFGSLDDSFCAHALKACGERFSAGSELTAALHQLRTRLQAGAAWPQTVAGPRAQGGGQAYWSELGRLLISGIDGGMLPPGSGERLRDLAHWAAAGLRALPPGSGGGDAALQARLLLLAGEEQGAIDALDRLLGAEADADALAELAVHLADAALARGQLQAAASWLAVFTPRFEALFGSCYELRLAAFRLLAGAASPTLGLLAGAASLLAANRKSARQDLTREPIWRVVVADPGRLLDTTEAAALIGRSTTFLAKRLENRTIPYHRTNDGVQGEQIRVPEQALVAWKAVIDEYKLLD
jgi:hypothetical protein